MISSNYARHSAFGPDALLFVIILHILPATDLYHHLASSLSVASYNARHRRKPVGDQHSRQSLVMCISSTPRTALCGARRRRGYRGDGVVLRARTASGQAYHIAFRRGSPPQFCASARGPKFRPRLRDRVAPIFPTAPVASPSRLPHFRSLRRVSSPSLPMASTVPDAVFPPRLVDSLRTELDRVIHENQLLGHSILTHPPGAMS